MQITNSESGEWPEQIDQTLVQQAANALVKQALYENGFVQTFQQFRRELVSKKQPTTISSQVQLAQMLGLQDSFQIIEHLIEECVACESSQDYFSDL